MKNFKRLKKLYLFGFLIVLMTGFDVSAENKSPDSSASPNVKKYVLCRNQKIVRTIRVDCAQNGECDTIYTKDGADRKEGSQINMAASEKISSNIQRNLEKAGWKCSDVTANTKTDN